MGFNWKQPCTVCSYKKTSLERVILHEIMSLQAKHAELVIPGDFLGSVSERKSGHGTYVRHGKIYSSFCGKVIIEPSQQESSASLGPSNQQLPLLSVCSHKKQSNTIPDVSLRVICKVMNISERQARVRIIIVEGNILQQPLRGVIRKADVRAMEKDSVVMFHSFRPGDLVRARVISLGEGNQYVLSTAENELGVFAAHSESGATLVPVSWCEMQCSKTGLKEKRKVAKVIDAVPVK